MRDNSGELILYWEVWRVEGIRCELGGQVVVVLERWFSSSGGVGGL